MGDFVTAQRVLPAAKALSLQVPDEVREVLMDLQAAILQGGGGEDAVVVDDFGHDGQAIRDALESMQDRGKTALLFNSGTWNIDPDALALPDEEGSVIAVPSGTRVIMRPSALIVQQGLGPAPEGESPFYHVFRVEDGTTNVQFLGVNGAGEKPVGEYTYNHQSTIIDVMLTEATTDVMVYGGTFRDLWGFPVHCRADLVQRCHAIRNKVLRCANGINICSDYSIQTFNEIIDSEGFELSGAFNYCAFNILKNALGVGISCGGNGGITKPGTQVIHNTIHGVSAVLGQPGIGIIAAENFCRGKISYNHVENAALHGIQLSSHAGVFDVDVDENHLYSNGATGVGGVGIYSAANTGRHNIRGNKSRDLGQAGYQQYYGMVLNAPDCRVTDNDFKGTFHDASYDGALRTLERDNRYENGTQETSGSTFVDTDYSWRP